MNMKPVVIWNTFLTLTLSIALLMPWQHANAQSFTFSNTATQSLEIINGEYFMKTTVQILDSSDGTTVVGNFNSYFEHDPADRSTSYRYDINASGQLTVGFSSGVVTPPFDYSNWFEITAEPGYQLDVDPVNMWGRADTTISGGAQVWNNIDQVSVYWGGSTASADLIQNGTSSLNIKDSSGNRLPFNPPFAFTNSPGIFYDASDWANKTATRGRAPVFIISYDGNPVTANSPMTGGWINRAGRLANENYQFGAITGTFTAIPEPGTASLAATGIAVLACHRRRKKTRIL